MSENRYSVKTVSDYLGLNLSSIYYRMRKLNIPVGYGLSAQDVKKIKQYPTPHSRLHTTLESLTEEMEAMRYE